MAVARALSAIATLVRRRPVAWVGRAGALALGYYFVQALVAVARFGSWPNSFEINPYGWLWALAPSWRDAVALFLQQPLIELSHRLPGLGDTEWRVTVDPLGLPVILIASLLLSAFTLLAPGQRPGVDRVFAIVGAVVAALFSVTLGWVACHTAPGWVLLLMSATNGAFALTLEPLGPALTLGGLALLTAAVLRRAA